MPVGMSFVRITPIWLFSSSTVPMASMRNESLSMRWPLLKPVMPLSPVRVYILERRCPICVCIPKKL